MLTDHTKTYYGYQYIRKSKGVTVITAAPFYFDHCGRKVGPMRIPDRETRIPDSQYETLKDRYLTLFIKSMATRSRENDRYRKIIKPILDDHGIKENTATALSLEMFIIGVEAGIDFMYQSDREFVV